MSECVEFAYIAGLTPANASERLKNELVDHELYSHHWRYLQDLWEYSAVQRPDALGPNNVLQQTNHSAARPLTAHLHPLPENVDGEHKHRGGYARHCAGEAAPVAVQRARNAVDKYPVKELRLEQPLLHGAVHGEADRETRNADREADAEAAVEPKQAFFVNYPPQSVQYSAVVIGGLHRQTNTDELERVA